MNEPMPIAALIGGRRERFPFDRRAVMEGLPNGMAVVLKTTVRQDMGVRVPHPPLSLHEVARAGVAAEFDSGRTVHQTIGI